ncbi:MAG: four helix bundle protein [Candidatus Omnitrophica bacterium]|nr:four helix bundle protein [Candidatus Omnitrophota bacterium]
MKINRFEDLECWQEARKLVNMVYSITKKKTFSRDYRLIDQFTGAAISIMNNIAEGFDSQSNIEFKRFLRYSRRSISEVQNCLYIAMDQKYIELSEFNELYEHGAKTIKVVDGMLRYLKGKVGKH